MPLFDERLTSRDIGFRSVGVNPAHVRPGIPLEAKDNFRQIVGAIFLR
jgi:hypothetical protein